MPDGPKGSRSYGGRFMLPRANRRNPWRYVTRRVPRLYARAEAGAVAWQKIMRATGGSTLYMFSPRLAGRRWSRG